MSRRLKFGCCAPERRDGQELIYERSNKYPFYMSVPWYLYLKHISLVSLQLRVKVLFLAFE
jgi:hypothetical protein